MSSGNFMTPLAVQGTPINNFPNHQTRQGFGEGMDYQINETYSQFTAGGGILQRGISTVNNALSPHIYQQKTLKIMQCDNSSIAPNDEGDTS